MRFFLKHCGPRVLQLLRSFENLPTAIGLRSRHSRLRTKATESLVSDSTIYAPLTKLGVVRSRTVLVDVSRCSLRLTAISKSVC